MPAGSARSCCGPRQFAVHDLDPTTTLVAKDGILISESAAQAMYAIASMCRVLEVSTSGYHAWRKRCGQRGIRIQAVRMVASSNRFSISALARLTS